jgi:CDP-diacylglycerol--glycerol-3-phosphate 3-phosphatidyltransferase
MAEQQSLADKLLEKGKVFTFSNFLSFIRLPLALLAYYLILNRMVVPALIAIIIAIISDFADGYFARKWNQVSEMGKVLDPLGDKVSIALGCIALYQSFGMPLWVVAVIIGRDILILLGSILLVTKLPYVTPSNLAGKTAVTFISGLALSYLLNLAPLQIPLQILTITAIVVSGSLYALNFFRKYMGKKESAGT